MRTLGPYWQNQVGAYLMLELIDLKKNTNNDEVEESVMDKDETGLAIIVEKGLQAALTFPRLLKVSSPSSFAKWWNTGSSRGRFG